MLFLSHALGLEGGGIEADVVIAAIGRCANGEEVSVDGGVVAGTEINI